jgi:CheY-like chemotaxis protein
MTALSRETNRRSAPRAAVRGSATLWHLRRIHARYVLRDVSVGGCLLLGSTPAEHGKLYHAVLCIEGHRHCLRRTAWMVRQAHQAQLGWLLGLGFFEPCGSFLPELVSHRGRVLVAHPSPRRLDAITACLAALGYEAVEAHTQAEAIWQLENGPTDFLLALVASHIGESDGQNLLNYVCTFYPHTRRVLLHAPGAINRPNLPPGLAHALLAEPFTTDQLAELIPDATTLYPSPPTSKHGSSGSIAVAHSSQNRM